MKRNRAARLHALVESLELRQLFAFGNIDPTFGVAGHVSAAIKNQNISQFAEDLVALAGGKVLAGGNAGLVKLNADGTADNTFGSQGRVRIRGFNFKAFAVAPSGSIFAVGRGSAGTILACYTPTGSLNANFGTQGTVLVGNDENFSPTCLAIVGGGDIVIGGNVGNKDDLGQKARVYKLTSGGTPFNGFGTNGVVNIQLGKAPLFTPKLRDNLAGVSALSNGKIMLAGGSVSYSPSFDASEFYDQVNGDAQFVVARLNADGTPDGTFSVGGIVRSIYADADTVDAVANSNLDDVLPSATAFKADGSVAIGVKDEQTIVRYFNASGGIVYSARPDEGSPVNAAPVDMTFLSDGRLVVQTPGSQRTDLGFVIAPVSASGEFLPPVYTNDLDKTTPDLAGYNLGAIVVATDGKLVVAGQSIDGGGFGFTKYSAGKLADPRPDEFASGTVNSIRKDSAGGLHVAYYDSAATVLKYVYRAPNGLWNAPVTVDSHALTGQYMSLAINKEDQPGIAYFDATNADLKFASTSDTGKNWAIEVVASKGSVGQYPSMLFDSKDRPTITFYNLSTGDLIFGQRKIDATTKIAKWGFESVDSTGDVGREGTLVVSNSGRFTVAYLDSTNKAIKWAAQNSGGLWDVQTATTTAGGAKYLSMAYSNSLAPAIAYYDPTSADLKMVYFANDTTWKSKTIAADQAQGQWSKVLFSGQYSEATVYGYNKSADKVTRFTSVLDTPAGTTIASGGGQYLSIDYTGGVTDFAYVNTSDAKLRIRYGQGPA